MRSLRSVPPRIKPTMSAPIAAEMPSSSATPATRIASPTNRIVSTSSSREPTTRATTEDAYRATRNSASRNPKARATLDGGVGGAVGAAEERLERR